MISESYRLVYFLILTMEPNFSERKN